MTQGFLEKKADILRWLREQNTAFVRFCGDHAEQLIQHAFYRIAGWSDAHSDLTALTHYSQGRMMRSCHLPFKGMRGRPPCARYADEPYYSITFITADNENEDVVYPDKDSFQKDFDFYGTPTALNISFCLDRLAVCGKSENFSRFQRFSDFAKTYWAGTDGEFSAWEKDFFAGVAETGMWGDTFYDSVMREFRFNATSPFPECAFENGKIVFDAIGGDASEEDRNVFLCFFEELLFFRTRKRHLLAPLCLIYFNEGRESALWRIYKNDFTPDFEETRPRSGRTDHLFSSRKNAKDARTHRLELKKKHCVRRLYFCDEPVPEFDGVFR